VSPSRRAAFEILLAVEAGGLTSTLLPERTATLDPRDAGLATELVLGVLRRRPQLHFLLDQRAARPAASLDLPVRLALELGAYQLRFLDRIPPHAAVGESVELVKQAGKRSAAGFANAILRRLPALPGAWPTDELHACLPAWLLARWQRQFGLEAALAAAGAALQTPPCYVRVPPGFEPPPGLETTTLPGCFLAPGGPPPRLRIMDIGAQAIVPLLDLQPGHRFLDLCAAPGNKTAVALETPNLFAVACDASPRRLRRLLLERGAAARVQLDAAQPLPFGPVFDRILVDAPCSGTGTLARHPEIKWRLLPGDLARHATRQRAILRNALACLKPGGLLVYATCSLEPEENKDILDAEAAGRVEQNVLRLPGRDPGDGFHAAVVRG
jgi:16S rRNA (cytosine967-C5)-methyltransferase